MLILKLYPKDFLKPLLCGFLLAFLVVGNVQGNEPQVKLTPEERGWLAEHPDIKLGFTDTFEPYLLKGDKGKNSGILVDFLSKLNQRLGTQFVIEIDSWPTTLEKVKNKELSGVMAIARETAEAHGLLQTESILSVHPVFYTNSNAPFSIEKLDDIRGRSVAILKSAQVMENILEPYKDAVSIVRLSSNLECLQMLFKGEVDIAFGLTTMNYLIGKHNLSGINAAFPMWKRTSEVAMGVRPDWPELVSILNKGIASFSQDEINALMVKWINVPVESPASLKLTKVEKDWLAQHPVVTVGVWENPPAQFRVDGVAKGYRVELMEAMLRDAGLQPRYRFLPLKDILKGLREGSVDIAMAFLKTPERSEYLNYSLHEFQANFAIFAQTQRTDISDMASLRGKTVGSYKGYGLENALKAWSPDSPVVQADDVKGMLRLVATGEADFCVQEITSGGFHLQQEHLANVEPKGYFQTPGGETKHSFDYVVRKSPPILTSILHKAEQSMASEEKQRIWNQWYPSSALSKQLPEVDFSKEERDWLDTHPKISFAFPLTYPPALMSDKEGRLSGQLKDILDLLNRKMGTDFGIVAVAGGTALNELHKSRKVAGQLAVVKGNGAARGLLETNSLYTTYPIIYSAGYPPVKIDRLEDVKGKTVVALNDALYAEKALAPVLETIDLIKAETLQEVLTLLVEGKADFMIGTNTHAYQIAKRRFQNIAAALIIKDPPMVSVMGVRDDWPELIGILNKGLDSILENEWNTIFAKWSYLTPKPPESLKLMPEEQAWLAQNQTVRVRIADWPPYLILKGNEPPSGIVIEYLKLIREKTGITFKNEVSDQPFAEFLERMKQRKGPDMAAIIVPTPEREQYLSFSQTYISSPYVIFIREQDKPILDINGLAGKTLAVPRGFDVQERLARDYPEIRLVLFDSDEAALQSVATGQSDAYIGNLTVASHIIHRRGFSGLQVAASGPFKDQSLSMGNRNDWPELTSIIDKALAGITEEEKTAIRNKYLAIKYEQGMNKAEVLKWVLIVAAAAFGVVLVFVFWNNQLSRKIRERTSELSESEEKYRGLVDNAIAGVFVSTPDGRFTFVNDAMARMFDFDSPEQMMAEGSLKRWRNLKDRERMRTELQQHGSVTNFETGAISHTDRNIQVLFSAKQVGNDIVGMGMDISDRQRAEQKLQHYQQRLKALALELTIAEEKERHRIAQNLHDNIIQSLALTRIQIASVRESTSELRLAERLDDISHTLFEIIENLDQLMFELSSPLVDEMSLSASISGWLEGQIEDKHGLPTEFIDNFIEDRGTIKDQNLQAIMFRNVKELLVNVVKHARANKVCVRLDNENSNMKVFVEDDGIGFDSRKTIREGSQIGGFGLFSIEERMADLGGSLKIVSEPGKGCRAILCVPFELDNNQERI